MSGEPPEVSPGDVEPRTTRMPDTLASPPTERLPENEGPPEISRFLDPLPSPARPSEPPPSSGNTRRRSRRTVKIPTDAIPQAPPQAAPRTTPPPPPVAAPAVAEAPVTMGDAERVPQTPVPAIPPAPPVPSPRVAPTLPAVPRPAPRPAPAAAAPPEPPKPSAPPAADTAKPAEETVAKAEEAFEVIRPMRIISIDATPPSAPAPAPAAPPASTPPAAPSAPPPPAAAAADGAAVAQAPAKPPRPKPPVVEEVEAVEEMDEPVTETSPSPIEAEAEVPRAARTDEIEPIPFDEVDDHEGAERISEADIAVHSEPGADAHVEVSVDVDDAPKPKKPPPPPPKRAPSTESPVVAAEDARPPATPPAKPPPPPATAAQASAPAISTAPASSPAPSSSVPTLDLAGKRRQKPWWEEIFSDDFIRTMEKVEPRVIKKECDFIEDRLGLEKGAVMLDLACGAGLHAVELASRGYNVVGYDLSLAMLARAQDEAQDRGQKINFLQGDMREMAFEEAFDGMFSWSTSFGYFDDEKNLNVLSRVYRGLRQGGMFLLDVINRDYVCPRQPSLVWFEGDGCVCMDEMHVDFFTSRLRVKRTVMFEDGRSRECDYAIRLYGLNDLGKMLHDTGFKVVEVTGHPAHPGVFFGSESPRIIILAERS